MSKDTLEFKRLHRTTDSGKQLTHDKIWPQRALLIIKHKWRREEKLQSVISHHFPLRKGEAGGGVSIYTPTAGEKVGAMWETSQGRGKKNEIKMVGAPPRGPDESLRATKHCHPPPGVHVLQPPSQCGSRSQRDHAEDERTARKRSDKMRHGSRPLVCYLMCCMTSDNCGNMWSRDMRCCSSAAGWCCFFFLIFTLTYSRHAIWCQGMFMQA